MYFNGLDASCIELCREPSEIVSRNAAPHETVFCCYQVRTHACTGISIINNSVTKNRGFLLRFFRFENSVTQMEQIRSRNFYSCNSVTKTKQIRSRIFHIEDSVTKSISYLFLRALIYDAYLLLCAVMASGESTYSRSPSRSTHL